jgi:hypothetical protein
MVSVGAPGMANSTTSLWFSASAYATVLGATLIRYSDILKSSFVYPVTNPIEKVMTDLLKRFAPRMSFPAFRRRSAIPAPLPARSWGSLIYTLVLARFLFITDHKHGQNSSSRM